MVYWSHDPADGRTPMYATLTYFALAAACLVVGLVYARVRK